MSEYVCLYTVDYYNLESKIETERGLLFAASFVDAVTQLETHIYGQDLAKIHEMELYDTTAVFSQETFNLIKKELEGGGIHEE